MLRISKEISSISILSASILEKSKTSLKFVVFGPNLRNCFDLIEQVQQMGVI